MKKTAPATSRRKATPRTSRVKRYLPAETEALREAVRLECLKQFERRVGRAWDAQLERFVRSGPARLLDQREAVEVQETLRAAVERAVEFVKRPREYAAPLGLGLWVPRFIEPLSEHDFLRRREAPTPPEPGSTAESERHRLVAASFGADFLGAGRRLDATELAIVWLLGGGFPEKLAASKSGVTPSQVIQAEARAFRVALREVGKPENRPTYRARFEQDDAGHWSATAHVDAERTIVAKGTTLDEAHQRLRDAIALLLDDATRPSAAASAKAKPTRSRKPRRRVKRAK
jgi:predicted RNase H-like HicB family nuclease